MTTTFSRPTVKYCSDCDNYKPLGDFHVDPTTGDGRHWRCADCKNAYMRRHRIGSTSYINRTDRSTGPHLHFEVTYTPAPQVNLCQTCFTVKTPTGNCMCL